MQIEHKTEKGTLCFVKVPDVILTYSSFSGFLVMGNSTDDVLSKCNKISNGDARGFIRIGYGFHLIGLTSEVTEEQAKMMVLEIKSDELDGIYYGVSNGVQYAHRSALNAIKSLMRYLDIYEVNPYQDVKFDKTFEYWNAQNRTGKWIVLFKPND